MNVVYGIMTGIGTIDRLKKKATGTMSDSEEECIPLVHIFGIGPLCTWPFPVDPIYPDFDLVMGYSTPQRLLREQMRPDYQQRNNSKQQFQDDGGGGFREADGASFVSKDSYSYASYGV